MTAARHTGMDISFSAGFNSLHSLLNRIIWIENVIWLLLGRYICHIMDSFPLLLLI